MAHWAYRALAPRLAALLVGVCTLAVTVVRAELSATVYGNTALAGPPVLNTTVAELAGVLHLLEPWQSVVVEGQITATEWAVFSVDTDSGFVRLRVDDHLLVDGGPAAALPPSCSFPGGDPSALPGYLQWQDTWIPVNDSTSPRSMSNVGGDCTKGCSRSVCEALCEKLAPQGCIGFYTHKHQWNFCSMRKLASSADKWQDMVRATSQPYTAYTRQASCPTDSTFCPAGAAPPPAGAGANGTAGYAVPIPFLPERTFAKLRLELTLGAAVPTKLVLLMNGTAVAQHKLSATVAPAERRYNEERAANEVGWNTWLSRDMLTHAWLPSGIALSIGLHQGNATVTALGAQGPSCSATTFPAKHGLHAQRGEYTEIETITVGENGASFRIESATAGATSSVNTGSELHVVITTLSLPEHSNGSANGTAGIADRSYAVLSLGVPISYRPRVCNTTTRGTAALVGNCPGFHPVIVQAGSGTRFHTVAEQGVLAVQLATTVGGVVSFVASADGMPASTNETAATSLQSSPVQTVTAARTKLIQQFSKFGRHNETYAGLVASIAVSVEEVHPPKIYPPSHVLTWIVVCALVQWNIIYNPYEGIITPVFRGAPWGASKAHSYVMFEWDTYLASMIASVTDPWAAANGIIRMTKALHFRGYVPGL